MNNLKIEEIFSHCAYEWERVERIRIYITSFIYRHTFCFPLKKLIIRKNEVGEREKSDQQVYVWEKILSRALKDKCICDYRSLREKREKIWKMKKFSLLYFVPITPTHWRLVSFIHERKKRKIYLNVQE